MLIEIYFINWQIIRIPAGNSIGIGIDHTDTNEWAHFGNNGTGGSTNITGTNAANFGNSLLPGYFHFSTLKNCFRPN